MNNIQHEQQKSGNVQFSTFRVANDLFGVDALQVQEILPYQEIFPVPLAPDYLKGLLNLRGQIVTVLDLRRRLGLAPLDDDTGGANLIVQFEDGALSLFVDQIDNVMELSAERLTPPPGTVRGVAAHYIEKVCQLEKDLLIILDLKRILQG